jgi:hypothetical protein
VGRNDRENIDRCPLCAKADIQVIVGYDCAWEGAQSSGASPWNFAVDNSSILRRVLPHSRRCYAAHSRSTIRHDRCV